MSWQHRKPEGVGDIEMTPDGFTAPVTIPLDEDGYFGRECPSCQGPFKMRKDEWDTMPDGVELTCPYCGHREEHSAFISESQLNRVRAAAHGLAHQFVHEKLNDMFRNSLGSGGGSSGSGSFIRIETRYTPGTPPPIEALPDVAEEATRRVVTCSACGNHHAVYSATAFCPMCGPRPATETVLEAIQRKCSSQEKEVNSMRGTIAVVREQGQVFSVVAVKDSALHPGQRDDTLATAQAQFGLRTVIMGERQHQTYGPNDIVRFLQNVDPAQLPLREFTLN